MNVSVYKMYNAHGESKLWPLFVQSVSQSAALQAGIGIPYAMKYSNDVYLPTYLEKAGTQNTQL